MPHKILVLGTYNCGKTGRLLAKELGAEYSSQSAWNDTNYRLVIRYGNSYSGMPPHRQSVMNWAKHIELVANKPRMRIKLLGNGVSTPKVYDEGSINDSAFPVIARPANHYKGKHFHIVKDMQTFKLFLDKGYYFQEIIDKDTEFRLFVFNDRIMEANIKVPNHVNANEMIRNHGHGWTFNQYPVAGLPQNLKDEVRHAARLSSLTFCAVDCCIDTEGKPYVFEVNSAPSLIPRKVTLLAKKIKEKYGL